MAKNIYGTPENPNKNTSLYLVLMTILESLFEAEYRRLKKNIERLAEMNQKAYGKPIDGFLFQGTYFRPESIPQGRVERVEIHPSLEGEVVAHQQDANKITADHDLIKQVIFILLDPCTSLQEMRDTLPECLVRSIPSFSSLSRTKQVGCSIKGDARLERQLEKAMPLIEMYAVGKMLY